MKKTASKVVFLFLVQYNELQVIEFTLNRRKGLMTPRIFLREVEHFGVFLLGIGGALGALSRFLLSGWAHKTMGSNFPYGTLLINIAGCFLLGLLGTMADKGSFFNPNLKLLVLIGFLGAFTTFSTFAYESWLLLKDGEALKMWLNLGGSIVLGLTAVLLGVFVVRNV